MDTKIYNPIKSFKNSYYPKGSVTQYLFENVELYKAANIGMEVGHSGIDIVAPWGTPIYAVEDGMVCEVKNDASGYGKHCRILSYNEDKKSGREYTFGHASENLVKIGDKVKAGQMIQKMGNTGFVVSSYNTTAGGFWDRGGNKYNGTHLHMGVREFVLDKKGWSYYPNTPKITILNYNNGIHGCVDFSTWFQEGIAGDFEILKHELEANGEEDWYIKLLKGLKFYGNFK